MELVAAATPRFHTDRQQVHLRDDDGEDEEEEEDVEEEEEEMIVDAPVSLRYVSVFVVFEKIPIRKFVCFFFFY